MIKNTLWPRRLGGLWKRAACLGLLLLTACTAPAAPTPDPDALVIAAPRGALTTALEVLAATYAQESGETVQVSALASQQYHSQVYAALLAGQSSGAQYAAQYAYDLVYLPAEDLARWAAYSAIQPLTGAHSDPAAAPYLPAVTVNGQVYGLPTQPDPTVLWYRADLLRAAGLDVPTTWDVLRQAAQSLSTEQGRYGILTARVDLEAGLDYAAILAGYGGEMVSTRYQAQKDSGEMVSARYQVQIDSEPARNAMETYAALTAPGAEGFTRADVMKALREGRAAFAMAPFSAGGELLDCNTSPTVCQEGQPLLAWAPLPGLDEQQAVGDLGAWAIPRHAAHPSQAQRFLEWLGSRAGASAWLQAGGTPAHNQVLAEGAPGHPLRQVIRYRQAFPPVPATDLLWKAVDGAIRGVVSGEQQPGKALDAAAGQMRQALRRVGYSTEE